VQTRRKKQRRSPSQDDVEHEGRTERKVILEILRGDTCEKVLWAYLKVILKGGIGIKK